MKIIFVIDNHELKEFLSEKISEIPNLELLGSVPNLFSIKQFLFDNKPDVIILDIDDVGIDSYDYLRKLIQSEKLAVIAIAPQTQKGKFLALQMMELGVLDFVVKPPTDLQKGTEQMLNELKEKLNLVNIAKIENILVDDFFSHQIEKTSVKIDSNKLRNKIVAIGSSSGSIPLIKKFLTRLPKEFPGMIIITPLPSGFSKTFANKMNEISNVKISEAVNKDLIEPGKVLIAPGDLHTKVLKQGNKFSVVVENGEKINGQRPSIDVLMHSLAEQCPQNTIGILLSGDTEDGIHGFLEMKRAGSKNILVDEKYLVFSTIVEAAKELRAADQIVKPDKLIKTIIDLIN
jgi:two-component system chemotaxis response regulator CheB